MSGEPSFPVFYDKTGKRLRRSVIVLCAVIAAWVGTSAAFIPEMAEPLRANHLHSEIDFARNFLAGTDPDLRPIIGDKHGALSRVVRVEVTDNEMRLMDPITEEFLRYPTEWEREYIGESTYAVEHYSPPPDKTLMLTFDDGPDPTYTPALLDLLSREGVPVTFFVIGKQVSKAPGVVERMVREGHMVANHTTTHIDFDDHGDIRSREEIITTDRMVRAAAGYTSRVFRMPLGDADNNPRTLLQAQQLGLVDVSYDIDTLDWSYLPGEQVPVPKLDGRGHVMLMHDAGGDRTATLEMVEKLIHEARAQGYTFTTLQPLLPPDYAPERVESTLADHATLWTAQAIWVVPGQLLSFLFWIGTGTLVLVSMLYLLLAVGNEYRTRRLRRNGPDERLPYVSVVLAAYNEAAVITRTLDTLRSVDYPADRIEVVAVNDGSSDDTLALLHAYAAQWPSLTVVDQLNSGKSSALNNGINHARPQSTVIVTIDADTLLAPDAMRMLTAHFTKNRQSRHPLGAVAGHVKVGNRRNLITWWQSLEYLSGICVTRMAEQTMGAVSIVPGACSAWSRPALEEIGGFNDTTLAEDADATLALQRLGYQVINENRAVAFTEAPETLRTLARQRKRWTYGNIQVLWKNRDMLLRPKYGLLGMLTMPYAVLSLLLPLVFLPFTVLVAGLSLMEGDWKPIVVFAGLVAVVHLIPAVAGVLIAREKLAHLAVVPFYRLIYEPLRAYLLYACAYRVVKGAEFSWDKLERRNTVVAFEKAGAP